MINILELHISRFTNQTVIYPRCDESRVETITSVLNLYLSIVRIIAANDWVKKDTVNYDIGSFCISRKSLNIFT